MLARGHQVRALTRRDQPPRDGVTWISGSLTTEDSLARLADGADAVLHVAGVVNGSVADFTAGNVDGTRNVLAPPPRHGTSAASSMSARSPRASRNSPITAARRSKPRRR